MVPLGSVPLGTLKSLELLGDLRNAERSSAAKHDVGLHYALFTSCQVHVVQDPLLAILFPFNAGDFSPEHDLLVEVVLLGHLSHIGPNFGLRGIAMAPVVVGLERELVYRMKRKRLDELSTMSGGMGEGGGSRIRRSMGIGRAILQLIEATSQAAPTIACSERERDRHVNCQFTIEIKHQVAIEYLNIFLTLPGYVLDHHVPPRSGSSSKTWNVDKFNWVWRRIAAQRPENLLFVTQSTKEG